MAEVVANTSVSKDKGYLYYLGKDGNVWRSQMARAGKGGGNAEKVADAGVTRESGFLYFIDKNGNAIAGYTALTKPDSKKFKKKIEDILSL